MRRDHERNIPKDQGREKGGKNVFLSDTMTCRIYDKDSGLGEDNQKFGTEDRHPHSEQSGEPLKRAKQEGIEILFDNQKQDCSL